jgi:hypothetical protein
MELGKQAEEKQMCRIHQTVLLLCINCFPCSRQGDRDFSEIQSRLAVDSEK